MDQEELKELVASLIEEIALWKDRALDREKRLCELEAEYKILFHRFTCTPIITTEVTCKGCDKKITLYLAKVGKNVITGRSCADVMKVLRNLGIPIKSYYHDEKAPKESPDTDIRDLRIPDKLPPEVGGAEDV